MAMRSRSMSTTATSTWRSRRRRSPSACAPMSPRRVPRSTWTWRSGSTPSSSAAPRRGRLRAEGLRVQLRAGHCGRGGELAVMDTAWEAALELLEDDLCRRDAAARTRRAYGVDLRQFARWAVAQGLQTEDVGPKAVRRYIAHLSERGAAPTTTARKLAALRALFRSQREHGRISQNPADLVSTPRRPSRLPRVLSQREAARLLDGIPAGSPLELRDRALFELAYSCGLRAEEIVSLRTSDVDHDSEQLRVEGKGRKTRLLPVGEPALAAVALYTERARPALAVPSAPDALFLSKSGRPLGTSDVR